MKINSLDLNLLVVLDSLLTTGSVVRTADRICLSPSAVSNALRRLREAFGDPMFEYDGRRLAPTSFALNMAGEVHEAVSLARKLAAGRPALDVKTCARTFVISVSEYTGNLIMNPLIRYLVAVAPLMQIEFVFHPADLSGALERRAVDFSIVPRLVAPASLACKPLWEDEMVCIGWEEAWRDRPLSAEDFLGASFVAYRPAIDRASQGIVTRKRLDVRYDILTSQYMLLPSLVVMTPRLAVLHRRLAEALAPRHPILIMDLPVTLPREHVNLYWHANWGVDPAREWLCSVIGEVAAGL